MMIEEMEMLGAMEGFYEAVPDDLVFTLDDMKKKDETVHWRCGICYGDLLCTIEKYVLYDPR